MKAVRWLRLLLSVASLAAMVVLFACPTVWAIRWLGWLPFVQLVPAVMACSWVVLAVLAVTVVLFGRLYCSVVCPLGISQDVVRLCFGRVLPRRVVRPVSRTARIMRLVVLCLFAVGMAFGFTGLIAPYGVFARFLSVCSRRIATPPLVVTVWAIGLFAFVLAMTFVRARCWCNRICPVGTFLGLFSRWSVFRVRVDASTCVKCGACVRACDKGALAFGDDKVVAVDHASCVSCFDCVGTCRKGALKWH